MEKYVKFQKFQKRGDMGKCQNIIARRSGKITRRYGKNSFFVAEIWENMQKNHKRGDMGKYRGDMKFPPFKHYFIRK
jgi:predicted NAD-dependent protein-ADP-ribosyltransferase YbiA (DUF1768 family)